MGAVPSILRMFALMAPRPGGVLVRCMSSIWGRVWTLTVWCEPQRAFRVFRFDRITDCIETDAVFAVETGKSYADYLAEIDRKA